MEICGGDLVRFPLPPPIAILPPVLTMGWSQKRVLQTSDVTRKYHPEAKPAVIADRAFSGRGSAFRYLSSGALRLSLAKTCRKLNPDCLPSCGRSLLSDYHTRLNENRPSNCACCSFAVEIEAEVNICLMLLLLRQVVQEMSVLWNYDLAQASFSLQSRSDVSTIDVTKKNYE